MNLAWKLFFIFGASWICSSYAAEAPVGTVPTQGKVAPVSAPKAAAAVSPAGEAKRIDVDPLKQRYWSGSAPDMNVVQNRIYKKSGRINFQANYSMMNHDPFLSTTMFGGAIGYNFTEAFGLHALYWKVSDNESDAMTSLVAAQKLAGGTIYKANTNPLKSIIGGEATWSILYGKLSLLGKSILHFDLFLLGGAGVIDAQNGKSFGKWVGVGQQMYITTFMALKADYRFMFYGEDLVEQNSVLTKGTVLTSRTATAPVFSLGLSFYLF